MCLQILAFFTILQGITWYWSYGLEGFDFFFLNQCHFFRTFVSYAYQFSWKTHADWEEQNCFNCFSSPWLTWPISGALLWGFRSNGPWMEALTNPQYSTYVLWFCAWKLMDCKRFSCRPSGWPPLKEGKVSFNPKYNQILFNIFGIIRVIWIFINYRSFQILPFYLGLNWII